MILVTGASGFLGQHLVRYLSAHGRRVRALYNNTEPGKALQLPGIEWLQCDLLDIFAVEEAMQGVTHVYHCAGIVSYDKKDHNEMIHFNTESTANVVNQALEQGIEKMVHVSSIAALGKRQEHKKEITEEEEWEENHVNSAYGQSKYLAEMEVWRGMAEGLNAVVINPGIILGAGDFEKGSARLIKTVNKEFPFYTDGITAWADAEDVVRVMHALMESDVTAERFIISSGNYAYRYVFTLMANALNKKPPHIHAGKLLTGLVWRANAVKKLFTGSGSVITKETARNAQQQSLYNNEKLQKFLPGFVYTPIEATAEKMAQSFIDKQ